MNINYAPSGSSVASQNEQAIQNQQLEINIPYSFLSLALQTLAEHDLQIHDRRRFDTTIGMGIKAVEAFFDAAYYEPSQDELDLYFQSFILKAVVRGGAIQ